MPTTPSITLLPDNPTDDNQTKEWEKMGREFKSPIWNRADEAEFSEHKRVSTPRNERALQRPSQRGEFLLPGFE